LTVIASPSASLGRGNLSSLGVDRYVNGRPLGLPFVYPARREYPHPLGELQPQSCHSRESRNPARWWRTACCATVPIM